MYKLTSVYLGLHSSLYWHQTNHFNHNYHLQNKTQHNVISTVIIYYREKTISNRSSKPFLEFHQMWVLATGETEFLLEVALHEWIRSNGGEETSIDGLLVGLALLGGLKFWLLENHSFHSSSKSMWIYSTHKPNRWLLESHSYQIRSTLDCPTWCLSRLK